MFGIIKTYRNAKKGMRDPAGLAQDLALDVIKDPLILFTILTSIFFGALIVTAFTGLLGGPYLFVKIIFWILFIPFVIFELIVWTIFGKIKKLSEKVKERAKKEINTIDAEII